jgi:hypothetical protein
VTLRSPPATASAIPGYRIVGWRKYRTNREPRDRSCLRRRASTVGRAATTSSDQSRVDRMTMSEEPPFWSHRCCARMARWGKVVGGHFMNATIDTNRKGELALQLGGAAAFKRRPTLTADTVAAWEEITSETRGGAAGAISNVGQAVARAALPGGPARRPQPQSVRQSIRRGGHHTRFELTRSTETSP